MKIQTIQVLTADEGMVFIRQGSTEALGETLYLGIDDTPDNYIETPKISLKDEVTVSAFDEDHGNE